MLKPDRLTLAQEKFWFLQPCSILSQMDGLSNYDCTMFVSAICEVWKKHIDRAPVRGYFSAEAVLSDLENNYKRYRELLVWDVLCARYWAGEEKPDVRPDQNIRADDFLADQKYRRAQKCAVKTTAGGMTQ